MPRYFIYKNNTLFNSQKNKSGSLFDVPIYKFEVYKQYQRLKLYCQQFGRLIFEFFGDQRCARIGRYALGDASYMSRQVRSLKRKIVK